MPLTFTLDPPVDTALRDSILTLWVDVSDADGAVGFVPPVNPDDVRAELVRHFVSMAEGGPGCSSGMTVTVRAPWRPRPSSRTTPTS